MQDPQTINEFSPSIIKALGYYVYRLIDPRNGETFYVGKGIGNRVFAHVNGALAMSEGEDEISEKLTRIREIRNTKDDNGHPEAPGRIWQNIGGAVPLLGKV